MTSFSNAEFREDLRYDILRIYRTLFAGLHYAGEELISVKDLLCATLFDNEHLHTLDYLIGGESLLAVETLSTTSDAVSLRHRS